MQPVKTLLISTEQVQELFKSRSMVDQSFKWRSRIIGLPQIQAFVRTGKCVTEKLAAPFAWLGAQKIIQYAIAIISLGIGPGTHDCDETVQVEKAPLHIRTG